MGDVEAVRIAHETIGRLLGAPGADAVGVIDLPAERTRCVFRADVTADSDST